MDSQTRFPREPMIKTKPEDLPKIMNMLEKFKKGNSDKKKIADVKKSENILKKINIRKQTKMKLRSCEAIDV